MTAVTTLPWGRPLSADDFFALQVPDDGRRYELLDGVLVVTPSPFVAHQRAVAQLFRVLDAACPSDLGVFTAPLDVRLSEQTVVEPDLLVVRRDDARGPRLLGVPLLCVEVLSDATRGHDLLLKRERYERAGVASYWVVDPQTLELLVWQLEAGRYEQAYQVVLREDTFALSDPFPLQLDLRHDRGRPRNTLDPRG